MLYREIESYIESFLLSNSNKLLTVTGARQIGKSYIIYRHVGKKLYKNFIEINLLEDKLNDKIFENVTSVKDFYLNLSSLFGDKLSRKEDTLIFLDEVQTYPELLTLFKFLKIDDKYNYIASGSLLGVTLFNTSSVPIGSIELKEMYQLSFKEFLIANNFNKNSIESLTIKKSKLESLDKGLHNRLLNLFKEY
ncbi:MAG: AAA family ATPase [Acholeplasmataceae bacterium]